MSQLDKELAQAVEDAETAHPAADGVVRTVPEAGGHAPKRSLGLLAALLVMGGGILLLVMTSFEDAAVYSKGVDELLAENGRLQGRNVKVNGTLVRGTLVRRDQPCEYRFKVERNGKMLHYAQCVVPDTFRDVPNMDVDVTAEGKLTEAGHFEATQIMAKCPSKYEMKERAEQGEAAPHGDLPPARQVLPAQHLD
jgi:cytochrome c-type biogenesis protein CcmE